MDIKFKNLGIVFNVKDVNRTEQFYKNIIGIDVMRNIDEAHGDWLLAVLDNGVELMFFQGEETIGRSPIVVFELDEGYIDDLVNELSKEGVEIVTPVSEAPGGWSADFLDPDGHPMSFYQDGKLPRKK